MGEVIRLADRRRLEQVPTIVPDDAPAPLWREVLGARLRALRRARGERLADTAARAGISPQYLSELERGRKDPSSEILAAVTGALATPLGELVGLVHSDLSRASRRPRGPVLRAA